VDAMHLVGGLPATGAAKENLPMVAPVGKKCAAATHVAETPKFAGVRPSSAARHCPRHARPRAQRVRHRHGISGHRQHWSGIDGHRRHRPAEDGEPHAGDAGRLHGDHLRLRGRRGRNTVPRVPPLHRHHNEPLHRHREPEVRPPPPLGADPSLQASKPATAYGPNTRRRVRGFQRGTPLPEGQDYHSTHDIQ